MRFSKTLGIVCLNALGDVVYLIGYLFEAGLLLTADPGPIPGKNERH